MHTHPLIHRFGQLGVEFLVLGGPLLPVLSISTSEGPEDTQTR
jgi:hypothetical protein